MVNYKKVAVYFEDQKIEILSPVLGKEELYTLYKIMPKGCVFSTVADTTEQWDGKTVFMFRQNGKEKKIIKSEAI